MAAQVHLDPDRLRELAAVALALADEVAGAIAAPPVDAECAQLHGVAAHAVRELTDVGSALFRAAQLVSSAEDGAVRALGSL